MKFKQIFFSSVVDTIGQTFVIDCLASSSALKSANNIFAYTPYQNNKLHLKIHKKHDIIFQMYALDYVYNAIKVIQKHDGFSSGSQNTTRVEHGVFSCILKTYIKTGFGHPFP